MPYLFPIYTVSSFCISPLSGEISLGHRFTCPERKTLGLVATKCCVEVSFYEICAKTKYVSAHNGVKIYTDWGVMILVVFEGKLLCFIKVLFRYLLTGTEKGKSNISVSIPSDPEVNRERNLPNTIRQQCTAMLLDHSIRSPRLVNGLHIWIYIYIYIQTLISSI